VGLVSKEMDIGGGFEGGAVRGQRRRVHVVIPAGQGWYVK
jgi:hypothetical protein